MKNANLAKARKAKNDEFYTQIHDIENELQHYNLKGNKVYSNCDGEASNFVKYFTDNYEKLGLEGFRSSSTDFRLEENVENIKWADIVTTNPPFSLFRDYIDLLVSFDKDFIVIGNMNAITYKNVFELIKQDKVWVGVNSPKLFELPDVEPYRSHERTIHADNGKLYGTVPNAIWFTNIEHGKRYDSLLLDCEYNKDDYPKYENYDAIEVSKTANIPYDYNGEMGVPISFLNKYNPDQFDILGIDKEFTSDKKRFLLDGKRKYARIVIKRK